MLIATKLNAKKSYKNHIRLKFKFNLNQIIEKLKKYLNVNFNILNIVLIATINYHLYKI